MEYFNYVNIPFIVMIFILLIAALILYVGEKDIEKKPTLFLLFVSLFLFYATIIDPYNANERVKENIAMFHHNEILKCKSNNDDTYIVKNDEWNLEGDQLIHQKSKLAIRIDRCDKYK